LALPFGRLRRTLAGMGQGRIDLTHNQ